MANILYGGTKSEMQRLLDDAGKIAGVKFNIDSYSDVIEAIHIMQTEMGIAGTTAEEGSKTISGSITKLGAAWDNFLTGIFDENANLGVLGENLFTSIGDVIMNVAPRIGTLITNLITKLPEAIITALTTLPAMLEPTIMEVFGTQVGGEIMNTLNTSFGGFAELMSSVATAVVELFKSMYKAAAPIIKLIVTAVSTAMPLIQKAINVVVTFVTTKVIPMINSVLATFTPVITAIASSIEEKLPAIQEIISTAMTAIQKIIDTVWPYVKGVITAAVAVIKKAIELAWPVISTVVDTAVTAIKTVVDNVFPAVQTAIETVLEFLGGEDGKGGLFGTVWNGISTVVGTAVGAISTAIEGFGDLVDGVKRTFESIQSAIEDPLGTAKDFIDGFAGDISDIIGGLDLSLPDIALPHFYVWGGNFPYGIGGYGDPPEFDISWYAHGGMVDDAQLIGAGERGAELIWPSYDPYLTRYADAIADRMDGRGGVDIHDCTFNVRKDSDIRAIAQELNTLINRQTVGGYA